MCVLSILRFAWAFVQANQSLSFHLLEYHVKDDNLIRLCNVSPPGPVGPVGIWCQTDVNTTSFSCHVPDGLFHG